MTFAFTDIEGSTLRWERDRAAMQDAVRRHDTILQAAIGANRGHVFKTVGDAFCAAFSRPEDAVAAMLAAQRGLVAEDFSAVDGLRVRAAMHTGSADERDGDYFGPCVNRVARLLAIAHGGQVLLSGATGGLVQGVPAAGTTLRDLGEHRLKDLARPEQVYELLAPGLLCNFPPLRSLDALQNNLPPALTSFIGREDEIAEISSLLEKRRIVTLVGAGGVGKTRASLQVAANVIDGSRDGVWLIELAPLTSGDYIPSTVAHVLGFSLPATGDSVDNLARALTVKHALLLFDNCEHLLEPVARVVSTILRACPNVKVLASSRQALGIGGEQTYRMPSLAVPSEPAARSLTAEGAANYSAISLFAERAGLAVSRFALSDENAPDIAEICRRLDGIPLAIELAAARVKILSPRELRERLEERFSVLTGGGRDVMLRHRTLRALIDWSYDLLDERERSLFRRLGIFVNGFTINGAAAVGNGGNADNFDIDIFDALASLIDKSMLLAEPAGDVVRYRLLESTRAYAVEKLAAAGELETCARRHLRYLHERFAEARRSWERTGRRNEVVDALIIELDDVRVALDTATGDESALGTTLLADTGGAWESLGLQNEVVARIETALAGLPEDAAYLRARLLIVSAGLAINAGQRTREFELATQAVRYARLSGDPPTLAVALQKYAQAEAHFRRYDEAQEALREADAIPNLPTAVRLWLLSAGAFVSLTRGDLASAALAWDRLRLEYRLLGDERNYLDNTLNLAEAEHKGGRTQRAIALAHEVLPALRSRPDRQTLGTILANLSGYLAAEGDIEGACEAAREAIRELAIREPGHALIATAIEHLAVALALRDDSERAALLEGYADAALRRAGYEREFTEQTSYARLTTLLSERFAPHDYARLLDAGAAQSVEAALALSLDNP